MMYDMTDYKIKVYYNINREKETKKLLKKISLHYPQFFQNLDISSHESIQV